MLMLLAAGWEAELLPALGGAIGALRHQGVDVLRPTPDGAANPLDTACFPLVPYANRIAGGRFSFGGRAIALPRNFGEHPHSLHGLGWQRAWDEVEAGAKHTRLEHRHDGSGGWPWRYRAEQLFELERDGLRVALTLANESDEAMPAGLGFHPYFTRPERTRLRFAAAHAWLGDADQLAVRRVAADRFGNWADGAVPYGSGMVDNAYESWDGVASLEQAERTITLSADGARDLHLFVPADGGFCCVEPVTHLPDAFNRPGDLFDIVPPGETMTLTMRISID